MRHSIPRTNSAIVSTNFKCVWRWAKSNWGRGPRLRALICRHWIKKPPRREQCSSRTRHGRCWVGRASSSSGGILGLSGYQKRGVGALLLRALNCLPLKALFLESPFLSTVFGGLANFGGSDRLWLLRDEDHSPYDESRSICSARFPENVQAGRAGPGVKKACDPDGSREAADCGTQEFPTERRVSVVDGDR